MNEIGAKKSFRQIFTTEMILALFTAVMFLILFIFTNFKTGAGINSFLKEVAYLALCSISMTMIILTGNIDISAGTMMGLCGYAAAYISKLGCDFYIFVPVAIALGMGLSFLNAMIITKFKVPAMVATLAMMNIEMGMFILLPQGGWVENLRENFTDIGKLTLLGVVPLSFVIAVAVALFFLLYMHFSKFPRCLYAIGGNRSIAHLSGVDYDKTIVKVFLIHGMLVGMASLLFYAPKGIVQANSAVGMEMLFITTVVVGGTSVSGGKGKLIGSFIGVVLIALINRAMVFFGFQEYYSYALQGIIILVAVLLSGVQMKKRPAKSSDKLSEGV